MARIPQVKIGDKINRFTVIEKDPTSGSRNQKWICRCNCGNMRSVSVANLLYGTQKSCGCLKKEVDRINATKHGLCYSRTYHTYTAMKQRCTIESSIGWKDYGGRGIRVCERWMENFQNFLDDMGECPKGMSINRIDNEGNYEKSNCEWADLKTQNRNKRNNVFIEYKGERKTIPEWSEVTGIKKHVLYQRHTNGFTPEEIFESPIRTNKIIEYKGESKAAYEWAKSTGISVSRIYQRLKAGWTVEDTLTIPIRKAMQ